MDLIGISVVLNVRGDISSLLFAKLIKIVQTNNIAQQFSYNPKATLHQSSERRKREKEREMLRLFTCTI